MKCALPLFAVLAAAACAAPSQGVLDSLTMRCSQGDRYACSQVPAVNAQVARENQNNQAMVGIAAGAGGLLGGAALGGAFSGPHYYRPYGYGYGWGGGWGRCYGCW